jgi:hypothetical protein
MKGISVLGLIFVIILGCLFVYVAEDIPDFGDPYSAPNRYVKLYSTDATEMADQLEQGIVPDALIRELKTLGFVGEELPTEVRKVTEGEWEAFIIPQELYYYPKEQKYYVIKAEGNMLDVYRYAPIVRYVEEGEHETEVPNMVTYILADYRGYDTLGETTVIFTAGISVILLLRRRGKKPE